MGFFSIPYENSNKPRVRVNITRSIALNAIMTFAMCRSIFHATPVDCFGCIFFIFDVELLQAH